MKKKIATLLMFLFSCLSIFTGCNLFDTNNYNSLNAVVATSGDIEITREQLVNAYNSSGYYYDNYYGYTREQALRMTIDDLINRQYLLGYVESLEKTDARYKLTDSEKYTVIQETWSYIDSSIQTVVEEVKKDLGLSSTELSTEEESEDTAEYAAKEVYQVKFEKNSDGKIVKISEGSNDYVPEDVSVYDYELKLSSTNKDYETMVWNRYITALKKAQAGYNYSDMSDDAVFKRELDAAHKTNVENAKLKKFELIYTENFGLDPYVDGEGNLAYYINDATLQKVAEKYTQIYSSNKELYNMSYGNNNIVNLENKLNSFYNTLTNTSSRENFFYYGSPTDNETLLTCMHILVKFSQEQTDNISKAKENKLLQENLDTILAEYKAQESTPAYERSYDEEGNETISTNPTYVNELFDNILSDIQTKTTVGYTNEQYVEQVVNIFDKYVYKYNQDTGILNAKFDYVVGTQTSPMVTSFTEVVRKLYNNGVVNEDAVEVKADYNEDVTLYFPNGVGYAGAISAPFLEEASNYTGYHIVLFTGTLQNVVADTINKDNVYEKLSNVKTSIAYNQDVFEFVFDKLTKDSYSNYQNDILTTNKKGTQYNPDNFSDMY